MLEETPPLGPPAKDWLTTRSTLARDRRPNASLVAWLDAQYRLRRSAGEFAWTEIGLGVALAGGAFPALLAAVALPLALFSGNIGVVFGGAAMLVICCGAAFMITGFVAMIVLIALSITAYLLGVRVRQTPMACFAGGLVAFVVCSVVWMNAPIPYTDGLVAVLIFPGLATPAAQYGSGYMALHYETIRRVGDSARIESQGPPPRDSGDKGLLHFSIRQLLALALVASLALTGLRFAGLLESTRLAAGVAVWSVFQLAPLWLNVKLIDRRHRKQMQRLQEAPSPAERST